MSWDILDRLADRLIELRDNEPAQTKLWLHLCETLSESNREALNRIVDRKWRERS